MSNIFKRFQYLKQQINHVIDLNRFWFALGISFPEGQHTFIWIPSFSKSFPSFWLFFGVWKRFLQKFPFTGVFSFFLLDSLSSMQVKPSLTVMHLPYLVKLDGTIPSCIFVWYLCIPVFSSNTSCRNLMILLCVTVYNVQ